MNVVFIVPYPLKHSPSQRFRFEQYFEVLKHNGIKVDCYPFFSERFWNILYNENEAFLKLLGVLSGFTKRFFLLFTISTYDLVFLHREATPIGPPIFEWLVAKVLRKKIIYDFDDSIWHTDLDKSQWLKVWLRSPAKTKSIIKWSWKVSCGNEYLCNFARKYNSKVFLNPTTIDTTGLHNQVKQQQTERIVIGWTGSHSTLKYLAPLLPVLAKLEQELSFKLLVICNQKPSWELKSLHFLPWNKDSELEDLMNINIGLMPLPDDEWSKGKCGFKALQYMALGIPPLVSPVGVNANIVQDKVNGFLCFSDSDWESYIRLLISDVELRTTIGKKARETVLQHYSVLSNTNNFLRLFNDKDNRIDE